MIWHLPLLSLIALLGLLSNGLILFSVIKYKTLRKKTYAYLLSLAVCDLLKVAVIVNICIYSSFDNLGDSCARTSILGITLLGCTTFHLAVESINRCFLVTMPYKYQRALKPWHIGVIITSIWIASPMFSLVTPVLWFEKDWVRYLYFQSNMFGCHNDPELLHNNDSDGYVLMVHIVFFAIPLTIMIVCYGLVLKTSYKIAQSMRKVEVRKKATIKSPVITKTRYSNPVIEMVSSSFDVGVLTEDLRTKGRIEHEKHRSMSVAQASREVKRLLKMRKREIKSSKTVLIMISAFLLCNAPIFTMTWVEADSDITATLMKVFLILAQLQTFIDPLVYFLRLKDFKDARKKCKRVGQTIIRKTVDSQRRIRKTLRRL